MTTPTDDIPEEIPPPPDLGFKPGERPTGIEWLTHNGRVAAATYYRPETSSGGLYVIGSGYWVAYGPISPADFQRNVATVLNTLSERWIERAEDAN